MFICGNYEAAKKKVGGILSQFGWETADMSKTKSARHRASVHALVHTGLPAQRVDACFQAAQVTLVSFSLWRGGANGAASVPPNNRMCPAARKRGARRVMRNVRRPRAGGRRWLIRSDAKY